MAVGLCERGSWPRLPTYHSKRKDLVLLREGVDIAVDYFNFGERQNITKLTTGAKKWCIKYYKGYHYAPRRATGLLKTFPNLFNLDVEAHRRLIPVVMAPTDHSEPEGATPRELRRAERKAVNSEAFPEFAEPTLATPDEIDEIVELRPRSTLEQPRAKPNMRVDAAMLRGTGLLQTLPEFLGQLARANLETETMLANNPDAVRFELDEAAAEHEPHIEMDLFAGVAETQRRRHARRVILPGGRSFKLPDDDEQMEDDSDPQDQSHDDEHDDSGNESDASTSTTASLRIRTKKRKAAAVSDDNDDEDEESQPNKIRIQYHHPTPVLQAFDLSRGEVIKRNNPAANTESDPFVELFRKRKQANASSPTSSSSDTSSSSPSSRSSQKAIKIKVVSHSSSSSSSAKSTTSGSSRDVSRASTPEFKIIRVQDPHSSSSSTSSTQSSPRPSPRIKIVKRLRSVSPLPPLAEERVRPSSSGSDSSTNSMSSGKSSGSSVKRIKLINFTPRSGHQEAIPRR